MQTQISAGRISEAAGILAAGILRAKRRQIAQAKNNATFSKMGLDFSPDSSVHCNKASTQGEKL